MAGWRAGTFEGEGATLPSIIALDHVRARWAYSEILSPQHGHLYRGQGMPRIRWRARRGVAFDALGSADRSLLAKQFGYVRGGYFSPFLLGITRFILAHWSRDQLAASQVIPWFAREIGRSNAPVTFREWIETEPQVPLDRRHARYAAGRAGSPFVQDHPVTVGIEPNSKALVLLDGYHRAVRFWRKSNSAATLMAYVPDGPYSTDPVE